MPDKSRKILIVDPSSCGFAKGFSYLFFTEKPNSKKKATKTPRSIVALYCMISTLELDLNCNISNQALAIQSLNPTFERYQKICSTWGKNFLKKRKLYYLPFHGITGLN